MGEAKKEKGHEVKHGKLVCWLGDKNKAGFGKDMVWKRFEIAVNPEDESEFLIDFVLEFQAWVNSSEWPESALIPVSMKGKLPAKDVAMNACTQQGWVVSRVRDEIRKSKWQELLAEFSEGKVWEVDLNKKPDRRRAAIDKQKIMVEEFLTRSGKTEEEVKAITSDADRYKKVIDYLAAQEVPDF